MEEIKTKQQVINEHQTGMNTHTHHLVVMVKYETNGRNQNKTAIE